MTPQPPAWWQTGWPRQRVGSVAEAELLSQLAVLLMPRQPILELFRRFPSPEGWRGHYLDPDLSAYGVLKNPSAALFVEYDGYWRHGEKEGMEKDEAKNAALLAFAPAGSHVIRISHTAPSRLQGSVLWVQVSPLRSGDQQALGRTLGDILTNVQAQLRCSLKPSLKQRWKFQSAGSTMPLSAKAAVFTQAAKASAGLNTLVEISEFLTGEGYSGPDLEKLLATLSSKTISIEQTLKPALDFFLALGLSKSKAAKAAGRYPQILRCSIEQNLRPTVQWLLDLGLSKAQVAKAVARFPAILGHSIEKNLKPTVHWLLDLGLSKDQVAKAVAVYPQLLGLSIEQNLKPTLQWLLHVGLTTDGVAKACATYPQLFGLSITTNLDPKIGLLLASFGRAQATSFLSKWPQLVGYSLTRLTGRLKCLKANNEADKLLSAMPLTEDKFTRRFCRSSSSGVQSHTSVRIMITTEG